MIRAISLRIIPGIVVGIFILSVFQAYVQCKSFTVIPLSDRCEKLLSKANPFIGTTGIGYGGGQVLMLGKN